MKKNLTFILLEVRDGRMKESNWGRKKKNQTEATFEGICVRQY